MKRAGMWGLAGVGVLTVAFLAAAEPPPDPPKKPTVEELRARFPFESIAGRLDYEPGAAEAFAKSDPPPRVTADTLKRLEAVEKGEAGLQRWGMRIESLKLLHSDQAQKFIDRDGFGVSRMPTPSVRVLDLPTAPTIPFAAVKDGGKPSPPAAVRPKDEDLAGFHQQGAFDFLSPSGLGYIKDREHVAGFQPHQFRRLPALNTAAKAPEGKMEQWAVVRLELVSLLKHDQPCVYVTNALPRMVDAQSAPTRPLFPFEEKGLKALKDGEDLATESSDDRIRMVGSLRAGKQCMECHEVKRGDLLGAFSWELQRQTVGDNRLP